MDCNSSRGPIVLLQVTDEYAINVYKSKMITSSNLELGVWNKVRFNLTLPEISTDLEFRGISLTNGRELYFNKIKVEQMESE
jgi:hypothetical protein